MSLTDDEFSFVQRLVREEAGLTLGADKDYLVKSRLGRLAHDRGDGRISLLLQRAQAGDDPALRAAIAEAMMIQETYFFRDAWLFDSLRNDVLPALIRARAADKKLRIWCAACATGQEAYSLCMVLRKDFPQLASWDIEFLASDFSGTALAYAAAGRYSMMEVNRGMPALLLTEYFRRAGIDWEIVPEIRRMVRFERINLVGAWPEMSGFDIVLLRNVLIYFDQETRRDVLLRIQARMHDDAYLFMGGTESPSDISGTLGSGDLGRSSYYRISKRKTA